MPRPPEAVAIKPLEQELETFRAQYNLITEALNVKKVGEGALALVGNASSRLEWFHCTMVLLPWVDWDNLAFRQLRQF
jgi:hypothetical protein